jgi:hypothetical protein
MDPTAEGAKIYLHVYFPGHCVAQVNVVATAQIQELRRLASTDSVTYMSNGTILDENHTFEFYGLRPSDTIVALPGASQSGDLIKWITFTRDSDAFSNRITGIVRRDISREAGRIRDMQLARMERRPRTFRKLLASAEKEAASSIKSKTPTIIGPPAVAPGDQPLPPWGGAGGTSVVEPSSVVAIKDEQGLGIRCRESAPP